MIAIDLGSNTLRIVQYRCEGLERLAEYGAIVKTADRLAQTGRISEGAVQRVIDALLEAQEQIDFAGDTLHAVTTEAIRRASNTEEVLRQIREATGVAFEVISGDEEARLTLEAVHYRLEQLGQPAENFVLVDIGGGSTEVVFWADGMMTAKSFPIGIVTIAQSYETLESIGKALPEEMKAIEAFCADTIAQNGKPETFVATAGTPTTVAAMKQGMVYATYDAGRINGTSLDVSELRVYLDKLLAMPLEQREIAVGVGRSDLIAAGILIFEYLFALVGMDRCVVVDDGLREGVALERCR